MRSGETYNISYSIPMRTPPSGASICPCCEEPVADRIMDEIEYGLSRHLDGTAIYPDPA